MRDRRGGALLEIAAPLVHLSHMSSRVRKGLPNASWLSRVHDKRWRLRASTSVVCVASVLACTAEVVALVGARRGGVG